MRAFKTLGVCYVLIDGEICHQLHEAKIIGVPLRAIPTLAHLDTIPREDGINGDWFRPEEVDDYALYIDTIEFGPQPQLRREQALYRIYHDEKEFLGGLDRLVPDLNAQGESRFLAKEAMLARMNCGLQCATSRNCRICYNAFEIAKHYTLTTNPFNNKGE